MSWEGKRARAILKEGTNWLMSAVSCLINRHHTGHLEGLTTWPKEWLAWAHYDTGRDEYEREKGARAGRPPPKRPPDLESI